MATHPFAGAAKKKPTLKHRPAIWECMLGTVYARNAVGGIKYFDYDWDAAREWAGVNSESKDLRLFKSAEPTRDVGPHKGQLVLYVLRNQ